MTCFREAADRVVKGKGKFEELMVCSQEIAASTAQLVVASKVKAERGSENLQHVSEASKGVSEATGQVVASAKSGAERIEDIGIPIGIRVVAVIYLQHNSVKLQEILCIIQNVTVEIVNFTNSAEFFIVHFCFTPSIFFKCKYFNWICGRKVLCFAYCFDEICRVH